MISYVLLASTELDFWQEHGSTNSWAVFSQLPKGKQVVNDNSSLDWGKGSLCPM